MLSAIEVDLVSTVVENWSVAVENRIHSYAPGPIKTSVDFVKMHFLYNIIIEFQFFNVISDGEEPVIHLNKLPNFFCVP